MTALAALCVLFWPGAVLAAGRWSGAPTTLRDAMLAASVAWSLWLVAGTELLGLGGWLTRPVLVLWWGLPTLAFFWLAWRRPRSRPAPQPAGARPDLLTLGICCAVAALLLVLALLAAGTPPNNWDSQVYHLPRQVIWMQQGSVAHFPTANVRQLAMPPFAEFVGLHLMVLAGNDCWANLVQWFALAMSAVTASLLAREFGGGARAQALAALLVVCNPMAAMQAVNTKNDLVTALWLCASMLAVLRIWTSRRCRARDALMLGATFGLLLLTKGTAYAYAPPVALAGAAALMRAQGAADGLRTGMLAALIALALNAGHFARNVHEFGSPLGPDDASTGVAPLFNARFGPTVLASNVVRNLALHAGTPSAALNARIENAIGRLHRCCLQLGTSDPDTTYAFQQFGVRYDPVGEDSAGAPLHLLLGLLVVPLLLLRGGTNARVVLAALVTGAAFVLFCWLLRWQPWHARLHLPLLCLLCPVAAFVLARESRGFAVAGCALLAAGIALQPVLYNRQKPLLGPASVVGQSRLHVALQTRPTWREPLQCLADVSRRLGPVTVAIESDKNEWEYIVQRVLLDALPRAPRFAGLVRGVSGGRREAPTAPDLIVRFNEQVLSFRHGGRTYVAAAYCESVLGAYVPGEAPGAPREPPPLPAFFGWRSIWTGMLGELEGPYPEWRLPLVRWGLGPYSILAFDSEDGSDVLVMAARSSPGQAQTLRLELNDRALPPLEFPADGTFRAFRIPLAGKAGTNVLVMRYAVWDTAGARPLALLFSRLQVLPARLDAADPDRP